MEMGLDTAEFLGRGPANKSRRNAHLFDIVDSDDLAPSLYRWADGL